MKRITGILLLLPWVLSVSACGNKVEWGTIEDHKNATSLNSSYVESPGKLVINIDNPNGYLKDIAKDKIIVRGKGDTSSSSGNELTVEDLLNGAITNYTLDVEAANVKITLPEVNDYIYYVIFNKASTKDEKFAYAHVSLLEDSFDSQSYVKGISGPYVHGQANPTFFAECYNLEIDDTSKVTFDGAFKGMTVGQVKLEQGMINFTSNGNVGENDYGTLTLEKGFFKDVDYDMELYFDVQPLVYQVDSTSFDLANGEFSFNLLYTGLDFNGLTADSVVIGDHPASKIEPLDGGESAACRIYLPFDGTIDEALAELENKPIHLAKKTGVDNDDDPTLFCVHRPYFDFYSEYAEKKLDLHFRYRDVTVDDITQELISFSSPQLILEGENKNASVTAFNKVSNGFDLSIEAEEAIETVTGTLSFSDDDALFQTLWGTPHASPAFEFSTADGEGGKGEFDEKFSEKIIIASPSITAGHLLEFGAYAVQLGVAIKTGAAYQAIGSLVSLLQLFGLGSKSSEPSIQDVLNKLESISNQLKIIDRKLDALKEMMINEEIATQIGITTVLFNQYRNGWETFHREYIEKADNLLRNYLADLRSYYVDFVKTSEDADLELCYFDNNGTTTLSMRDPISPEYSLEGYKLISTKQVKLTKSYFKEAADLVRKYQGYTKDFDILFRACLKANLEADNPTLSAKELEALNADVYAHLTGLAQFTAVNKDRSQEMTNLFLGFARHLSGVATGYSQALNYYKMLESLYNFQSEAAVEMKQFRTNMKLLLDKYAGYATTMAQFCSGTDKAEITDAYTQAHKYIKENDNLRKYDFGENYCYSTHRKMKATVVCASFNAHFDNAPSNKCVFQSRFALTDMVTSKDVDPKVLANLYSASELNIIYARVLNALRTQGKTVEGIDFYKYMKDSGIITPKLIADRTFSYSGKEVITSYKGINSLSSENFAAECIGHGMGSYFDVGKTYGYKSARESGCWSAREATGTVYNLEAHSATDESIQRMARYDEGHWYWFKDEHWAFEQYRGTFSGRMAFMIYKL